MHLRVSKHLASAAVATLEMTVQCHPTVALARTAAARVCACPTLRLLLAIAASGKRSCAVVLIFSSLNLLSSRLYTLSRLTSFSSSPSFYFLLFPQPLLLLSFSLSGVTGTDCSEEPACFGNTCSGNGNCVPSTDKCVCNSGFFGSLCQNYCPFKEHDGL